LSVKFFISVSDQEDNTECASLNLLMMLSWEGQGAYIGELDFRMMKDCCACCSLQAKHEANTRCCCGGRRQSVWGYLRRSVSRKRSEEISYYATCAVARLELEDGTELWSLPSQNGGIQWASQMT